MTERLGTLRMRDALGSPAGLLVVAAIWGSTFVVVKEAVALGPPLGFLALRFSIASLAMIALFRRRSFTRSAFRPGLIVGALLFVGFATQTAGLQWTGAAKSAFITSTYVLFVPLVVWAFDRRLPGRRDWLPAVGAVVGIWLLVVPETGAGWSSVNQGDVLTGLCAMAFALHIVVLGRAAEQSHSVASLATTQVTVCAGLAIAGSLGWEPAPRLPIEPAFILAAFFTGLLATAFALAVQTAGQRRVEASRAAVLLATEPLFAAVVALVAGESWTAREVVGAAVILAATLAVVRSPKRNRPLNV